MAKEKTIATISPEPSSDPNAVTLNKQFDIRLFVTIDVNNSYPSARPDFLRKCGDRILASLKDLTYAGHKVIGCDVYTEGMRKDDGSVTD